MSLTSFQQPALLGHDGGAIRNKPALSSAKPCNRPPPADLARSPNQAELLGAVDCLQAVAHIELSIQRARVLLDRVRGEAELGRDLTVRGPRGDKRQDLTLTL